MKKIKQFLLKVVLGNMFEKRQIETFVKNTE